MIHNSQNITGIFMPGKYVAVATAGEIQPGRTRRIVIEGHPVLIANVDGSYYAVDDMCTHEDSSLSLGCLKGELVSCTLHGSRFSVITGEPAEEPATEPLKTWPVRVQDGEILLGIDTL
jgi:3-phenylpropionate/trans-cinnamate dioxygenase ferredoxin subunit